MKTTKILRNSILSLTVVIGGASQAFAQFAATGNTIVSEATGAGIFGSPYTGTTNFSYKVRTTKVGGAGTITVKISSDFAAGGPSVTTPPAGDAMTYSCTTAASATPCVGPITASTAAATSVATFATDAHSAAGVGSSDAGTVTWTLPNDPVYKTATYTATATFTISAT